MKIIKIQSMLFFSTLFGCASVGPKSAVTASDCQDASACRASGFLAMTSDGHGFIGEMILADGSCLNVSLPDEQSEQILGRPPAQTEVQGPVLPLPSAENIIGLKVNGRKVGFGRCGDFYVFVQK